MKLMDGYKLLSTSEILVNKNRESFWFWLSVEEQQRESESCFQNMLYFLTIHVVNREVIGASVRKKHFNKVMSDLIDHDPDYPSNVQVSSFILFSLIIKYYYAYFIITFNHNILYGKYSLN